MSYDETQARIADLEAQVEALVFRLSAHEWLIEQHLANALVDSPDAEVFLDALSHVGGSAWRRTEEGTSLRPTPPDAQRLEAEIVRMVEKIRTRVRQGRRRQDR